MTFAKRIAKEALQGFGLQVSISRTPKPYNAMHRELALKELSQIEQQGSKLAQADRKKCDAYARDVLGSVEYAPWLYVYSAVSGCFKEGWIPNNYFGKHVIPKRNGQYGKISGKRCLSTILLNHEAIPDSVLSINGRFFDRKLNLIPVNELASHVFRDSDRAVFKLDSSQRGKGIYVLNRNEFDTQFVQKLGDGVFQAFVEQHGVFASFGDEAANTLRLTTVVDQSGEPALRAAFFRMSRSTDKFITMENEIVAAVDVRTGEMFEYGYTIDWSRHTNHPDTGRVLKNQELPMFRECEALVTSLHRRLPFVQCIGWDIVVDKSDRIVVLEWNGGHTDILFSEATTGPCFSDLGWEDLWKS